ncbi:pectate lyase [Ceratobasidium sp. AG-Ba]|nr:pectate lyase [Ceratobasidium sp. AG-Ba]
MVSLSLTSVVAIIGFFTQTALAVPSPTTDFDGFLIKRAASCTFPTPPKTSSLSAAKTITGTLMVSPNGSGNVRYDRGSGACEGQKEGGDKDAVFILQSGATLQYALSSQCQKIHILKKL